MRTLTIHRNSEQEEFCIERSLIKGIINRGKCITFFLANGESNIYYLIEDDDRRHEIYNAIKDWFLIEGENGSLEITIDKEEE